MSLLVVGEQSITFLLFLLLFFKIYFILFGGRACASWYPPMSEGNLQEPVFPFLHVSSERQTQVLGQKAPVVTVPS